MHGETIKKKSKHFLYFQKQIFASFNAFQRLHEHESAINGTNKPNQPRSIYYVTPFIHCERITSNDFAI
jgi:hypothetical protein